MKVIYKTADGLETPILDVNLPEPGPYPNNTRHYRQLQREGGWVSQDDVLPTKNEIIDLKEYDYEGTIHVYVFKERR